MANENWRPGTGKAIPTNTPIKVDSKFTTIGLPGAQDGWIPLNPGDVGQNDWFYRIDNSGRAFIKAGPSTQNPLLLGFDDYETINDAAADSTWASGTVPGKTGNDAKVSIQTLLQQRLEERAPQLGIRPSPPQPPPAAPGAPGDGGGSAPQPGDPDYVEGTGGTIEGLKDISGEFGQKKDRELYSKWKDFLQYPQNISSSGQDRLIISQIQYVAGDLSNTLSGSLSRREEQFEKQLEDLLGMVTLPMPNDISESNQVGWGEDSLSNLGAALMSAGMGVIDPFAKGQFGEASSTLKDKLGGLITNESVGTRGRQFLLANAAASIIKKGGINVNPESYISRVTGAAVNPNLELLFNGPKLRAFQFGFKMSPRNAEEARNIRAILKFFKRGMSPRRSTKNENAFFLGAPNVFKIKYASSSSELGSIGKIKTCALTSFNINYTPDGFYAAYNDGDAGGSQPVSVTMQLGFVELTPVFSDEYNDDITVGPDVFKGMSYTPESTTPPPAGATPPPQGVAGNPLLNPRAGQPPVLGGPGTAARAGQQGAFSEYSDGVANGTIPVNVPFIEWKRQKGYQ